MKKSRVLTLGLACFFTAVTAFSAVAATSGGGGALYSHLNDTSQSETTLSQQFSQPAEKSAGNGQNGGGNATAENLLIEPREDDPIIYTTDYGLDIKWGNALPNYNYSLGSGGMSGFPYFTTTKSGTTYTWVIIGRNSSVTQTSTLLAQRFDIWKTDKSTKSTYYQNNHASSPALTSINSSADTKAIVYDNVGLSRVKSSSELANYASSVLCLSNTPITQVRWTTSILDNSSHSTSSYAYTIDSAFQGSKNVVKNTCSDYYTNDTFGFGTFKTNLKSVSLQQTCYYVTKYSISGIGSYRDDAYTSTSATCSLYFFPLQPNTVSYSSSSYDVPGNFKFTTYLTAAQWSTSQNCWGRGMVSYTRPHSITSGGSGYYKGNGDEVDATVLKYIRPACVIQV